MQRGSSDSDGVLTSMCAPSPTETAASDSGQEGVVSTPCSHSTASKLGPQGLVAEETLSPRKMAAPEIGQLAAVAALSPSRTAASGLGIRGLVEQQGSAKEKEVAGATPSPTETAAYQIGQGGAVATTSPSSTAAAEVGQLGRVAKSTPSPTRRAAPFPEVLQEEKCGPKAIFKQDQVMLHLQLGTCGPEAVAAFHRLVGMPSRDEEFQIAAEVAGVLSGFPLHWVALWVARHGVRDSRDGQPLTWEQFAALYGDKYHALLHWLEAFDGSDLDT